MIRKVVVAIFLLALVAATGVLAGCGGDLPSDAVAKVGDIDIKEDVFAERVEQFGAQYGYSEEATDPEIWQAFKEDVLEYLITYEMAVQKAEDYNLSVTDEEVQEEIDLIVTTYYDGDEAALAEELAASDMTLDQLKSSYRESMLMQKVYDEVTKDITEVPDEEISAYYEENKDTYFEDETRTTRHILIAPGKDTAGNTTTTAVGATTTTTEITDADWADALETAEEVRGKLVAGGDWTELAEEYSDDTLTASSGGELGAVAKGEMLQEFEDAVFSLDKDEISEPVKSAYGYHIIQVTEITEAYQQTLEEAKEEISSKLLNQKQLEAWEAWIETTKTELNVVYREDVQPTTTLPAEPVSTTDQATDTTIGAEDTTSTTSTTSGETTTTAKP